MQDQRKPMSRAERMFRDATTADEIHQLAERIRKDYPPFFSSREMAAWERTINRNVSQEASSLSLWRQANGRQAEGPLTIRLVFDIAFLTALWLSHGDRQDLIAAIRNGERPALSGDEWLVWNVQNIRHHYMDSLAPYFAVAKKEYEGQKKLRKKLDFVPPALRPMAPLANAGEFQYAGGRLVSGFGPERPVSDDDLVYMRELLEKYAPGRGRPRVENPNPATLRKRRQRERERESVTNSCVRNVGEEMIATDEQLAQDAEQLAKMASAILTIALQWQARFPNSRVLADTVDRFIREALVVS